MARLPFPKPRPERQALLRSIQNPEELIERRRRAIYETLLSGSSYLRAGNFHAIGVADLQRCMDHYDQLFFNRALAKMVDEEGAGQVELRLSDRLSRAAGKTIVRRKQVASLFGTRVETHYEIAISTFLLFQSFDGHERSITIGGLVCRDRLEALQRIFEHELIHLAEFLAWGKSSCSAAQYRDLSGRIFGHAGVHHDLVTAREIAAEQHGVRVGDLVQFYLDHQQVIGRVNRITKRATILVDDPAGRLFTDGGRYQIYYVPLAMLKKVESEQPRVGEM